MTAETQTTQALPPKKPSTPPEKETAQVNAHAAKTVTPEAAAKKPVPRKTATSRAPARKTPVRKTPAKKTTAKKPVTTKTAASKPKAAARKMPENARKLAQAATGVIDMTDMSKEMETMFEANMKQMQDMLSEFKGGFADLPLANEEVGKMLAATRDATVTGMKDMNREISEFTQSHMTECWETTRGMLGAKSLPEAFEVQNKYFQNACKAYADEAQKLNTIATEVTQKALSPMSEGMFDMFTKMFNSRAA